MLQLDEDTTLERIMKVVCTLFMIATPFVAVSFIACVIEAGFSKETWIVLLLLVICLLSSFFLAEIKDITGEIQRRRTSVETSEKEARNTLSAADRYYEKRKKEADMYFDRKTNEANDFLVNSKANVDNLVRKRKQDADDYYRRKRDQIEDEERKAKERIDEYKEQIEEEIEEWKTSDDTLFNIQWYEFRKYGVRFHENEDKLIQYIRQEFPFTYSASMSADFEAALLEEEEKRMRWKPKPAKSSADEVSEVKKKFRQSQIECKTMRYKYEFLLTTFPELRNYVDDEKGLLALAEADSFGDFTDNYDRVHDYLSDEEYRKMLPIQRNQLALDHYNARQKSDWVAGTEYEMYCEYLLRNNGYSTIDFGVRNRLNDLGRDIIAKKDNTTYIIQCKRWAANRIIHENVICQLYGTTIEYNLRTNRDNNNPTLFDEEVVPVLMTTTELSDTAKAFAERLGVEVWACKMGHYPQIKCNISNSGEKIYHLPFDQQYYNAKINEDNGEMYAWTVEEAEKHGFRRAFRWQGNNSNKTNN